MSFSDDPSSPAAPFSGDNTGQIFDLPDMVQSSPTTTERVVDTQSGFLVVVKKIGDKISLFIKRQVGTPPSSSVPLTADETIKLSKILSSSFSGDELSQELGEQISRRRRSSKLFEGEHKQQEESKSPDLVVPAQSLSSVHVPMKLMLASVLKAFMVPILGVALSVFVLGIGAGIGGMKVVDTSQRKAAPLLLDSLDKSKVDIFVRSFVAKMLDFSPETYRASQVQAMSLMAPELFERYWEETHFPLAKRQLAKLPQGAQVQINDLKQERVDSGCTVVDVHAQLTDPTNPKTGTPVNLRLTLGIGNDGRIIVKDQQDLSAQKK